MGGTPKDNILLICDEESCARHILERLYAENFDVVGPVPNAKQALLLAGQSAPTLALVATAPTGRRDAAELARELMRSWGIRSIVMTQASGEAPLQGDEHEWEPRPGQLARLQAALGDVLVSGLGPHQPS